MKRVYIETTIPSFYHTRRADVESLARMNWTQQWWKEVGPKCHLVTSPAVIAELEQGESELVKNRLELIETLELLDINAEVESLAQTYIKKLVMPNDPAGDALHLALASYFHVDILLTWNCKHLANPNKFGHIHKVNAELSLPTPLLITPLNYLSEVEDHD